MDYLRRLGVSDCYVSPLLKARRDSQHCYDVVDHTQLNPQIGSEREFQRFASSLRKRGMGLVVDIVPNHMAASPDNPLWTSVLEYGPSSPFAEFFDVDWSPPSRALRGKVLLPVLTEECSKLLQDGRVSVELDPRGGALFVRIGGGERLPLAPGSYARVLGKTVLRESGLPALSPGVVELPPNEAYRQGETLKGRLSSLFGREARALRAAFSAVEEFNSMGGRERRAARFRSLLGEQFYLAAHWREASERINYRRFLLINDLVALRAERPEVFEESNRLVVNLVGAGLVTGLRIDHCDGLTDPAGFFRRLRRECVAGTGGSPPYVVVEKILGRAETLPGDWAIDGTTGYDFARDATALFVRRESEGQLSAAYAGFTGRGSGLDEEVAEARRLVTRRMGSELTVLSGLLRDLSRSLPDRRPVTGRSARAALVDVLSHFPVYRTYTPPGAEKAGAQASAFVEEAVTRAKAGRSQEASRALELVRDALLLRLPESRPGGEARRFVERFQHATVQAAVSGVEDTAWYRYNRLTSLNEVGGDPGVFGISVEEFHRRVLRRARSWPHAMLSSSTHDTKRSEDVRARINVISEIPAEWSSSVSLWAELNLPNKSAVGGKSAPSRNDEYLFYQTLVGVWPLRPLTGGARSRFVERMVAYALKAAREAKEETSWTDQNPEYERALERFVRAVLTGKGSGRFLEAFESFQRRVAYGGMLGSLSQLLLKLTCPGVPDVYQGNETWDFSVVDPDNRRDVNFRRLSGTLRALKERVERSGDEREALASDLLSRWRDGMVKMYVTTSTLEYRSRHRGLFEDGKYLPLGVTGSGETRVCSFARERGRDRCVVAVPTSFSRLGGKPSTVWGEARLLLGEGERAAYRNLFTGRTLEPRGLGTDASLALREVFAGFPVALLARE